MLLVAPQHLADAVVDDDGVVERIAEDGQQRRDAGQVEVDLRERHEADRQHDVVHVGDHGAERELPFEAEPEVDQDAEDREHQRRSCRRTAARSDTRGPTTSTRRYSTSVAERAAHLVRPPACCAASPPGCCGDADQHVVGRAELLQLHLAEAERRRASRASWRDRPAPAFDLHLDQRAAVEVDAEIQPVEEIERRSPAIDSSADIGKLMRRKRMKSNLVSSGTMRSRRTAMSLAQIGTRLRAPTSAPRSRRSAASA